MPTVYLDNHATTAVDPRVLDAMLPCFGQRFGNPASNSHAFGWEAQKAVERARAQAAALLGAETADLIFTSGATESNNLALRGVAEAFLARHARPGHLVISTIEHSAVLDPARMLERQGWRVTRIPVDRDGRVALDALAAALTPDTALVSIMAANNEIGVLQDMEAIGALTRARGIPLHTDATQAAGKVPVDVERWGVDLLSLSGHKMHGPKGVGALFVRARLDLRAQMHGGGHERGLRSGTLNVPGIVGLGEAAAIALAEMPEETARLARLRDLLRDTIVGQLGRVRVNGSLAHRLPHNLHLTFEGVEAEMLMMSVPEIAMSSGSACASARRTASHVLLAIGLSEDEAQRSLRLGLGRFTTEADVVYAAGRLVEAARQLRDLG